MKEIDNLNLIKILQISLCERQGQENKSNHILGENTYKRHIGQRMVIQDIRGILKTQE